MSYPYNSGATIETTTPYTKKYSNFLWKVRIPPTTLVMELLNAGGYWTRQHLGILSNLFYCFDLILCFKHRQRNICLPTIHLWRLNCTFYGSNIGSVIFIRCDTCLRKYMFTCFLANLLAFLACYSKRIENKIIHIPNHSAVSLPIIEGLFFHPPLKPFTWDTQPCFSLPSVEISSLCSAIASWHLHKTVLWGCACSDSDIVNTFHCASVPGWMCQWSRGADHSQRVSWHWPITFFILEYWDYTHLAVGAALSLSLTLDRMVTVYRLVMILNTTLPPLLIQLCTYCS